MIELADLTDVGVGFRLSVDDLIGHTGRLETIVQATLEEQINLFDLANSIGICRLQKRLGEVVKRLGCREQLFFIIKGGIKRNQNGVLQPDGSPENLRSSVIEALELLDFETLDCYQIHWPDRTVPVAETIATLQQLKDEGLIRYIGVSNFTVDELKAAEAGGTIDCVQFPYNLFQLQTERQLLPYLRKTQHKNLAYGVLCRGMLTEDFLQTGALKYDTLGRKLTHVEENFQLYRYALQQISDYLESSSIDQPLSSVLMAWALAQPGIEHVLSVAYIPEHVRLIKQATAVQLEADQLGRITEIVNQTIGGNVDLQFVVPPHHSSRTF